jgi:hypothetical protein
MSSYGARGRLNDRAIVEIAVQSVNAPSRFPSSYSCARTFQEATTRFVPAPDAKNGLMGAAARTVHQDFRSRFR